MFKEKSIKMKGIVTRQLYTKDGYRTWQAAIKRGMPKYWIDKLEEKAIKPMFKSNFLWKIINKIFGWDLQIPVLMGNWTTKAIAGNTVTEVGLKACADQVGGTTTAPMTAIAIGEGSAEATALGDEIDASGGERGAAAVTNTTTSTTGDTEQWIKSFTFTDAFAVTEEGIFDNNTSGGNMLASQDFSVINVASGDILSITHQVVFS